MSDAPLSTVRAHRGDDDFDPVGELRERTAAARERDGLVGRARVNAVVDAGSFVEVGTFTQAENEEHTRTYSDGKVGGTATIDGRPVMVAADEPGVHDASSARIGNQRMDRLMSIAVRKGMPFVFLADGGRLRPAESDAEGMAEIGAFEAFVTRCRQVPMAAVVVGDTTEASALVASTADLVVQVRGTTFSLSPLAPVDGADEATRAGSADANANRAGLVDLAVDDDATAFATVRHWLSFLPSSAWVEAPRVDRTGTPPIVADESIGAVVPKRRTRAYDVRRLIDRLVDPAVGAPAGAHGEFLELRPGTGKGFVTGLARIDGRPIAVFASNPSYLAGSMDPAACEKGIRLLAVCDAFQIPSLFVQDVAGFLVGRQVEHGRILYRAVRFINALYTNTAPTLTVVVRKAYGLAYEALNGRKYHTDGLYAWPGAEFGFMDPNVGVNVLYGDRKSTADKAAMVAELKESNSPFGAAAEMNIDEIIDPATTRQVIARDLALLDGRRVPPPEARPMRLWPSL